jgi:dihydroxy-acid dehydratase
MGISMGTEGMKYSLVSREVIADSIETAVMAQSMDAVLTIGGCDKNMPGAMIAIARMNVPAIFVYGGTIKPGKYRGKDLTIVSAFEAVGAFSHGKIGEDEFQGVENHACPGAGSCGGMYTANTMSSAFEAMGMSLMYSSTMAAEDTEKAESAAESGSRACRGGQKRSARARSSRAKASRTRSRRSWRSAVRRTRCYTSSPSHTPPKSR